MTSELLQRFAKMKIDGPVPETTRSECRMHPVGVYAPSNNNFLGQYNHIYNDRLDKLRRRFDNHHSFLKVSLVQEERVVICGLLHKRYKKKGASLDKNLEAPNLNEQVYSLEDEAELADESGSIRVSFNARTIVDWGVLKGEMETEASIHNLPQGVCFSAEGNFEESTNSFVCYLVRFPRLPPQVHTIQSSSFPSINEFVASLQKHDELILFTSGLTASDFQRLEHFLKGFCFVRGMQASISTVVICGRVLNGQTNHESLRELDQRLSSLASNITVFYMPSNSDFRDPLWPAKPISRYMLPNSANQLHRCSNPELLEIDRLTLLGTCGENIQEMGRVCTIKDPLEVMEAHIMFNHLAPSAPASLLTAPALQDCLVLERLPNVYFASGSDTFESKTIHYNKQACRLMLVPSFSNGVVLMNSRTTDLHQMIL